MFRLIAADVGMSILHRLNLNIMQTFLAFSHIHKDSIYHLY